MPKSSSSYGEKWYNKEIPAPSLFAKGKEVLRNIPRGPIGRINMTTIYALVFILCFPFLSARAGEIGFEINPAIAAKARQIMLDNKGDRAAIDRELEKLGIKKEQLEAAKTQLLAEIEALKQRNIDLEGAKSDLKESRQHGEEAKKAGAAAAIAQENVQWADSAIANIEGLGSDPEIAAMLAQVGIPETDTTEKQQ